MFNSLIAILKYTVSAVISTTVVINGAENTAGSTRHILPRIGRMAPIVELMIKTTIKVQATIMPIVAEPLMAQAKKYPMNPITMPIKPLTLNSLKSITAMSLTVTSPRAKALIINDYACVPEFPPTSASSGIKKAKVTTLLKTFS